MDQATLDKFERLIDIFLVEASMWEKPTKSRQENIDVANAYRSCAQSNGYMLDEAVVANPALKRKDRT